MHGETRVHTEDLTEADKAMVEAGLQKVVPLDKRKKKVNFAEGTNPNIKIAEIADPNIAGVLEGLDTAAQMSEKEQKNWAKLVPGSKGVRLREESGPFSKATEEGKLAGARRKVMVADTLKANEEGRMKADDDRWEAAELSARKRIGEEEQGWEDAELKARKNLGLEAHAKDEKRAANKLSIANLMKRLGFGRKEQK